MTRSPARRILASALGAVLSGALATAFLVSSGRTEIPSVRLAAANPATPGDFTGHAFDQCQAPSQSTMDTWLRTSPYLGVGVYIAGKSRGCRNQTYLDATWVRTQLAKGWKLLPVTLGPQASCNPRFPRYGDDPTIIADPTKAYARARSQGRAQAAATVSAAQALGLVPGSTMFYDLEAFDATNVRCRESALWFLSAWTTRIHQLGYVSGVYSSAGSGLKALDDARATRPGTFQMPDQVWIADWDGKATTASAYVRSDGWAPHRRVKQYQGGHNERWGGVTISIDRDYVDLGRGTVAPAVQHCGGVPVDFPTYVALQPAHPGYTPDHAQVKALKCFLREAGIKSGRLNGAYGPGLRAAVTTWQQSNGLPANGLWSRNNWVELFSRISNPILKFGSGSETVRDLQRALATVNPAWKLRITGVFNTYLGKVVRIYQKRYRMPQNGIVASAVWNHLRAGRL